jgi:hypothetical protein
LAHAQAPSFQLHVIFSSVPLLQCMSVLAGMWLDAGVRGTECSLTALPMFGVRESAVCEVLQRACTLVYRSGGVAARTSTKGELLHAKECWTATRQTNNMCISWCLFQLRLSHQQRLLSRTRRVLVLNAFIGKGEMLKDTQHGKLVLVRLL